jgi:hypothetical protein
VATGLVGQNIARPDAATAINLWIAPNESGRESEADVRNALIHIVIFLVALVVLTALAIWFNLGPVAYSAEASASPERRSVACMLEQNAYPSGLEELTPERMALESIEIAPR